MYTVRCPFCGEYLGAYLNKMGKPQFYCGICRYGLLLMSKEGIENFKKACEEIEETHLPEPTLKNIQEKLGETGEQEETG